MSGHRSAISPLGTPGAPKPSLRTTLGAQRTRKYSKWSPKVVKSNPKITKMSSQVRQNISLRLFFQGRRHARSALDPPHRSRCLCVMKFFREDVSRAPIVPNRLRTCRRPLTDPDDPDVIFHFLGSISLKKRIRKMIDFLIRFLSLLVSFSGPKISLFRSKI